MLTPRFHSRSRTAAVIGVTWALTACNFEVPASSYLRETTLIAVLIEVEIAETDPLNPDRIGVPSDAPIAEPMPHDRLAFEAYVVDRDGARLANDELDSLWFQCGPFDCGASAIVDPSSELFDTDCVDLGVEWTMDSVCRLGAGDGRFEFEVPELGQLLADQRVAQYYGVIGWEGRSAASCWAARRDLTEPLDHCGFIQRSVKVGPSWWMLAYAESIGLISPIPISEIPAAVYLQAANRVPIASFAVTIDGELQATWPEQDTFTVKPGSSIGIEPSYDELTQYLQIYFVATQPGGADSIDYLFTAGAEIPGERPFSSNAIVWLEPETDPYEYLQPEVWEFAVADYAEPGRSRVLLHYFDDRYGEGVANFVFEVQG